LDAPTGSRGLAFANDDQHGWRRAELRECDLPEDPLARCTLFEMVEFHQHNERPDEQIDEKLDTWVESFRVD
jgi:hypothetical protein